MQTETPAATPAQTDAWRALRRIEPRAPTTCTHCGATAAEIICRICKTTREHYLALLANWGR